MKIKSLLIALVAIHLSGCNLFAPKVERSKEDVLSEAFANHRLSQVQSVDYKLKFNFQKQSKVYNGETQIVMQLKEISSPLSIDSSVSEIKKVFVNDVEIADFKKQDGSLEIPAKYLAKDTVVKIVFENQFSEDGVGLTHFTDPVDGAEYIYSDTEPYGAHHVFPCLDQPSLKATYNVTITAPKEWEAIANENQKNAREDGEYVTHEFGSSKTFSTYLVFIAAGNFKVWNDEFNGLPLQIYARQSLAKFVEAEEIFAITKRGLEFYNNYFDYAYPFPKYAQVFCPDLGPGAMENPGAVSMNEKMIYRGPQPESARMGRANTILHEMAHMWFGDLVTMHWWNDLWLNESFATFMASLAQDKAFGLGSRAWQSFIGQKSWAYWQDQLVTTHPIAVKVADTNVAATNFDGITYGKGAATLKQLHFYVGEENFRNGVRNYFKTHAWKNATRIDFVNAIAEASKLNLNSWSRGWIESAGLNKITPEFKCENGKLASLELVQERTKENKLLPHRTRVALFKNRTVSKVLDLEYHKERTAVREARGLECPDFVYANYQDQDYAVTFLDQNSLAYISNNLSQIDDPMQRQLIWSSLSHMLRAQKLKLNDYLSILTYQLPIEKNGELLASLIGRYSDVPNYFWNVLTSGERDQWSQKLENMAMDGLLDKDNYYLWFDFFIKMARSPQALETLTGFLNKEEVDQTRRWEILVSLARRGQAGTLLDAEIKRDSSDEGANMLFTAQVAGASLAEKHKYWDLITDLKSDISGGKRRAGARAFYDGDRPEVAQEFVEPFFKMVNNFDWGGQMFMMARMFESLFPSICTEDFLHKSQSELSTNTNVPAFAKRAWLEANDDLEHCVNMRKFNQE